MNIEILRNFFLWSTIINYGILLLWCILFWTAHDWHYGITKRLFRVSAEQYDMVNLGGIGLYKLLIIVFSLVPYIALRMTG